MKKTMVAWIISSALILGFSPVEAAQNAGVSFADRHIDEGVELKLKGTGLKSVFFMKAFVAGFYSTQGAMKEALGEFPKRIEVEYFVSIPAQKMNDFTVKSMKDNVSQQEFEQITNKIKLMRQYFVDLKPGDRYSLTYIPDIGTKFVHNDLLIGTIEGQTFAKALFSTWLGPKPFDEKLKGNILGNNNNRDSDIDEIVRNSNKQ